MSNHEHKLSKDVQRALMSILVKTTLPDKDESYLVMTTSPGAWLASSGADSVTLLDLTGLIGTSPWSSEQDLRDRLVEQIVAAGWHETQGRFESVSTPLSTAPRH